MNTPIAILFHTVVDFALVVFFLRFMFQLADIDKKHPYSKATYTLSAVVTIFARIFPDLGKGRISLASVVLILLVTYIKYAGLAGLAGESLSALTLFFAGTLKAILHFLTAFKYIIFGSVVCSWIIMLANKMHPIMDIIMQMSEPLVAPFRRFTPNLGMIDVSTLVALLSLSLLTIVIEIVGGGILQKMT